MKKIGVLGAGSWGTALALHLARNNEHQVTLWGHRSAHIDTLNKTRCNQRYLPDCPFPDNLQVTAELDFISDMEALLLVVPSDAFRQTLELIAPLIKPQHKVGWAIKGFDKQSNTLLSTVFAEYFPDMPFAFIAGSSFAKEVAKGLPTAITVASNTLPNANHFASYFHSLKMRTYTTDDYIGAQIGGAIKNVIAIATGISDGLGFGANTRAALITRGLHEMTKIGKAVGANPETFMGLSGIGDLLLTCTDNQSRNRRMGLLLGEGKSIEEAQQIIGQTVEGVSTASEALQYAERYSVRVPIIEITWKILTQQVSSKDALYQFISDGPKQEIL